MHGNISIVIFIENETIEVYRLTPAPPDFLGVSVAVLFPLFLFLSIIINNWPWRQVSVQDASQSFSVRQFIEELPDGIT